VGDQFTHVIATDTPYYKSSPQQARPPEGTLKSGTKVRKTGKSIGTYEEIDAETQERGYVESRALKTIGERIARFEDPNKPKDPTQNG
jgi:hypothetical protein